MADWVPSVHVFSADSHVLTRWRQGIAGYASVESHREWMPPEQLSPATLVLIDLRVPGLPTLEPESWPEDRYGASRVACSAEPHTREGLAVLRCGFRGYCHWDIERHLWPRLLGAMRHGELWLGRSLLTGFVMALADSQFPLPGPPHWHATLTPREREVAQLVASGDSNKEVARRLGLSERTVKDHLTHIFAKLDLHDRVQLALAVHGINTPATQDRTSVR